MPAGAQFKDRNAPADIVPLHVEIEVSQPADVYLLSNGPILPEWLARDYTRTPISVGVDMDDAHFGKGNYQLGIGAGVSVDRQCSIWKRKQPVIGRARVGEHMINNWTYALIVVPMSDGDQEYDWRPAGREE